MFVAASLLLPFVMAAVLLASGAAKLRRPDEISGWAELGVPTALRKKWLVRLHPWAELALAVALIGLGGPLGVIAGLTAVALMIGYLALVVRALRARPDASCSCFGVRRPVTRLTVARNAWLTALATTTTAVIWMTPTWGGATAELWATQAWGWAVMVVIAASTALVIVWPDAPAVATDASPYVATDASPHGAATADGDELDYLRVRTPAVAVTLADGTAVNLRTLAARRPVLLLAVSPTCTSCASTIERAATWRITIPAVDVRLLVQSAPEPGSFTEIDEPQSVHDPEGNVRASIAEWSTPSAVLLGADGMLAGGPVTGFVAIEEFVEEIRATLEESAVTSP